MEREPGHSPQKPEETKSVSRPEKNWEEPRLTKHGDLEKLTGNRLFDHVSLVTTPPPS
jgi:hypothetical protein